MDRVEQAIADIKNGKMIVMVDDEDRENEGDLVFAGAFSDTQKVNFAITHARGVLCLAVSEDIAKRLELDLMVSKNTSCHETAFTVTIDAKAATTGVSAYERDMTIRLATDHTSKPEDFVKPGHIFPLIAKKGGVLSRTGHTEGSVDLCKYAGLTQSAVICEIVKDDGNMARRADLEEFCKKFNLNMVSVSELVEYRLKHESLISIEDKAAAKIAGFDAIKHEIKDHRDQKHFVFTFGEISRRANVKFHKTKSDMELLTSSKFEELLKSIKYLSENSGILVFLQDEKTCDNTIKDFGIGAQILRKFGIEDMELISSSKNREFVALSGFGLNIVGYKDLN
ncbi:bifunctional 3,4-dihydroxy-2-butanone 4-phosphate synthase/GTP cyclohydrolase II [Campylobacter sp. RM16192]|uniref:bifunctional 3,4-dihydroxy-2-butanone 4-phosphate synthase/GTP cyclohydrolase II n=1 Tax=Campylobacter sp. RM16192 TaxID=1660080 RepID=UPI0014528AAE|nr:bifunctional 3,4-dihydroxy-2-butanone 4-phosphate synthase/GTP cyclohydrolase II [Campylobacter sp. RM16192]QCD52528.1 bifunctional 3,4-dihydroxy-2-butanone 4-phosphate synthase / GTP cyclohydrolase II protein [Campylobacter sp. RM16192]